VDVLVLAQVLAYVASAIGVVMVAPQIARIVKNPTLGGVSPWTWAITSVSCSLWLTYGLRSGSMPQVPGNVLLISGAVAIVLLVPAAWSWRRRALGLAAVAAALILVSTRLSPEEVGFFALAIGLTGMWPQVYETVWLRRGMGPSAISMTSQVLKLVSQSLWMTFALITIDVPVIVAATMTLSTNLVVTVVEFARRRGYEPVHEHLHDIDREPALVGEAA
jgi:uncharacterized protein with PQ loop repeat